MAIKDDNKQAELTDLNQQIEEINQKVSGKITVEPSPTYVKHLQELPNEMKRSFAGFTKTLSGYFNRTTNDKLLKDTSEQTQQLISYLTDELNARQNSLVEEVGKLKELQGSGDSTLAKIAESLTTMPERMTAMVDGVVSKNTNTVSRLIDGIEDGVILSVEDLLNSSDFPDEINKMGFTEGHLI